jgi:hypothetical protein
VHPYVCGLAHVHWCLSVVLTCCGPVGRAPSSLEIFCPVLASNGNAAWPRSVAGATAVVGTCSSSYTGTPTRDCGITGGWGAISNGCVCTSGVRLLAPRRGAGIIVLILIGGAWWWWCVCVRGRGCDN